MDLGLGTVETEAGHSSFRIAGGGKGSKKSLPSSVQLVSCGMDLFWPKMNGWSKSELKRPWKPAQGLLHLSYFSLPILLRVLITLQKLLPN